MYGLIYDKIICAKNTSFRPFQAPLSADRLSRKRMWGGYGRRRDR